MAKFRKKPVVVEAVQFHSKKKPWPDGVYPCQSPAEWNEPTVFTLEGPIRVTEGDWIITGIQGEKYPCKPDIFEATYEAVEP